MKKITVKILFAFLISLVPLFVCLIIIRSVDKDCTPQFVIEAKEEHVDEDALFLRLEKSSLERLESMLVAASELSKWEGILNKTNSTVLTELINNDAQTEYFEHYPNKDSYDAETCSQYYYHSHRNYEHGHFHVFSVDNEKSDEPRVHLVAISLDKKGAPIGLFTTNAWVTGENSVYPYEEMATMVDQFKMSHAYPSWPVNQWVGAIMHLFYPQICDLIYEREILLGSSDEILEDRDLEIISSIPICVSQQIEMIRKVIEKKKSPY